MLLLCWFDHFLDSTAEICQIFRWLFGKSMKLKRHSEINWPLRGCWGCWTTCIRNFFQNIHSFMLLGGFLAFNRLHDLGGQKKLCSCYNTNNFKQSHWNKTFCMVWPWCCLFQHELPVKILIRSKLYISNISI